MNVPSYPGGPFVIPYTVAVMAISSQEAQKKVRKINGVSINFGACKIFKRLVLDSISKRGFKRLGF